MPTTDQDKPGGKPPRQRSRKANQPDQKPEQPQSPVLEERVEDQIEPVVASAVASVAANDAPAPADHYPVGIQAIANACEDYTRKSLLEGKCFVEKLMAVRSLDKAIEVQTEFTRQSYASFIAESQKMCELYRELAMQTLQPLFQPFLQPLFSPWGFPAKTSEAGIASWPAVSQSQH